LPLPSFDDLRRFVEIDAWEELERVRGGTGDHHRYRKVLADGTILRTRVSHGSGEIGDPGLWKRIWRDQLGLESEDVFWQSLVDRKPVDRGDGRPPAPSSPSIPGWVVAGLLGSGMLEAELRALDADEAQRLLAERWATPPPEN
jgi:hypothetical protein